MSNQFARNETSYNRKFDARRECWAAETPAEGVLGYSEAPARRALRARRGGGYAGSEAGADGRAPPAIIWFSVPEQTAKTRQGPLDAAR